MQTNENNSYHSRGLPLKPEIVQKLIIELFSGQMITRQKILDEIPRVHVARGGKPNSSSSLTGTIKSALTKLKKKGLAESLSPGYWQIVSISNAVEIEKLIEADEIEDSYEQGFIKDIDTETGILLEVDKIIGMGDSTVYLYYLPIYRIMAENNGESVWPCKIGRTDRDPLERILAQAGTALPEKPHLALIVKTKHPSYMENALHSVLKLRGKHIKQLPGSEWFLTSPDEVLELVKFFDPTLSENENTNTDAE
jgi:hypothetical protein